MMPSWSRSHWTADPVTAIEPFQRVHGRFVAELVAERRQEAVLGADDLLAGVEHQEVARAVRVLDVPGVEADLTDEGRMLVAEIAGDGDLGPERSVLARRAVHLRARRDLAAASRGARRTGQELVVPVERLEVHQHRAAGVGDVGDVLAGELPDHPGVHRAEQRVAGLGVGSEPVDVLKHPAELAASEVRGRRQPGALTDQVAVAVALQLLGDARRCGCPARRSRCAYGTPVSSVPHHGGLALVGDADRGEVGATRCRPRCSPSPMTVSACAPRSASHHARPSRPPAGSAHARADVGPLPARRGRRP